jgi:hypothetical protein
MKLIELSLLFGLTVFCQDAPKEQRIYNRKLARPNADPLT